MLGVDTVMRGNEIRGEYRESSHVWLPSKLAFRDRDYIQYTHSAPFHSFEALTTKVEGPELDPQRAIPRERNTMRLAAIATSWCGVPARRSHQSNIAASMQQSTS